MNLHDFDELLNHPQNALPSCLRIFSAVFRSGLVNVDDHEICISERWGEVVGHERVRTKIIRFGSGYPQRDKNSTSQEGLENACNLYDGAAMLAEGRVSGKAVG